MMNDAESAGTPNHAPPSPLKVGMITFLLSEVAFFGTLIMTYIFFLNQTTHSTPSPGQATALTAAWPERRAASHRSGGMPSAAVSPTLFQ